jgi:glycosyltransferase involved in cell wall biosynthesis
MKILVLYPGYGSGITGGQIYDQYLIERIAGKKEFQVDFITDFWLWTTKKFLYPLIYLGKFFTARKYDVILTNSLTYKRLLPLFIFLRLFSRVKLISIHHHFYFSENKGIRRKIHKLLELLFLRISYATIIPSPYIKNLFEQFLPKSKYFYIELGVKKSLTRFAKQETEKNNNLLFVGNIEQRKGLIYLIEALNIVNKKSLPFHCNIVGKVIDDAYFAMLEEKIAKFGLQDKITFCGRVSEKQLSEYYNNAYCFVFPSLLEGYGMVLIEAMSYGLPVVAFDNSAIPYSVKNGENGLLAENENAESFAKNISDILTNPTLHKKLSDGALQFYSRTRTFVDMDKEIDLMCEKQFNI